MNFFYRGEGITAELRADVLRLVARHPLITGALVNDTTPEQNVDNRTKNSDFFKKVCVLNGICKYVVKTIESL